MDKTLIYEHSNDFFGALLLYGTFYDAIEVALRFESVCVTIQVMLTTKAIMFQTET